MEESSASYLRRARALYEGGSLPEAEALLREAENVHPSEPGIRTFRAYLLYRQGSLEAAARAYLRLAEEFSADHSHLYNLGLIRFKQEKYVEARECFERLLEQKPGDPRALRNLGFCFRKLGNEERAKDCLEQAGGEGEHRIAPEAERGGGQPPENAEHSPAVPEAAEVEEWLRREALPLHGRAGEVFRGGPGVAVCSIDEKIYVKRRHLLSYRGVVVFSSSSRQAGKAAGKFGDSEMELIRVEGSGEVGLGGCGGNLHFFHLEGGREFHVNFPFLVCHGPGIDADYDFADMIKGVFLDVALSGHGGFVMAAGGDPVVLEVSDSSPAFVRAGCVLGWSGEFTRGREDGPTQGGFLARTRAGGYLLFEGRGYLLLQDRAPGRTV